MDEDVVREDHDPPSPSPPQEQVSNAVECYSSVELI